MSAKQLFVEVRSKEQIHDLRPKSMEYCGLVSKKKPNYHHQQQTKQMNKNKQTNKNHKHECGTKTQDLA